jgi:signal transduction histidine kinase
MDHQDLDLIVYPNYSGLILSGNYSTYLKATVSNYIQTFNKFEQTGNPAIPYISAWEEKNKKTIWYEYVSKRFINLLGCSVSAAPATFRDSIVDRIIYKASDPEADIQKEIFSHHELDYAREKLREDSKKMGTIDAVYKIHLEGFGDTWLKDIATVQSFDEDQICISIGCLTIVTKEMKAEEERLKRERLQVTLEMAGAVCHELNQPMQTISGYTETLLKDLSKTDTTFDRLEKVMEEITRMGTITKKLMRITKYETKDYLQGIKIVDIDKASDESRKE